MKLAFMEMPSPVGILKLGGDRKCLGCRALGK